jgi:general secretion pathway protein I
MTRPSSSGFTLLEVLIAFVILSLTLAAVFGAFSTGLHSLGTAEDAELAVLRAQSKLESAGLIEPLAASQTNGDFADGAGWQVDIEPFTAEEPGQGQLFEVRVSVASANGRRVELKSLRWSPDE